jgi:hypothetical protein
LAPLNTLQVIVMRVFNSVMTLHLDGVQFVSGAGPSAIRPVTSIEKGRSQALGSLRFAGIQPLLVFWDRGLLDSEILQISGNPWQIFESPRRLGWLAPSAAATIYRLISDTITNGWTAVGAASVAAATNETTPSDAEYGLSPNLSSSYTGAWPSMPAGNHTVRFRGDRTLTGGQVRIRYLDSGGTDVGGTAWQALTGTAAEYVLSATTTATATQARIEVQP